LRKVNRQNVDKCQPFVTTVCPKTIILHMNRIIPLLAALIVLFSCRSKDKTAAAFDDLLQQPPFKVYTDSIRDEPKKANLYFTRGQLLLQNQQLDAALPDFEKAWQLDRSDVTAYAYGSMLINLQRYDSAIQHLQAVSKTFPNNLDLKERLGYAYTQKKQPKEALAVYDAILASDSTAFRIWAAKAYLLQETAGDSAALPALEKSYSLQPTSSVGEDIALIYADTKNAKTLAFCDLLIRRDSAGTSVKPYFCKGRYYNITGNTAAAIKMFDYCIKEDYNFADAFMEKGEILYNQKQYEEALKIFVLTKNNNNSFADAYFWTGKCLEALGKTGPAALEYERAFALDKDFTQAKEAMERLKGK
jgi:tetratricopeptide (TPR) repeat protein